MPTIGLGLLVVIALLPFYPPTDAVGAPWGWAITGVSLALGFAAVVIFRRHQERITFGFLLGQQYVALGQLGLIQWLAGGRSAPYGQLLALTLIGVGFVHPPRRVAVYAAATVAVAFSPLLYASAGFPTGEVVTQMVVWVGLTATFAAAMVRIRGVRTGLKVEADSAIAKALTDELTGLGNRAGFQEMLDAALRPGERPVSLILIDIDSFKQTNDEHGHLAGDAALRDVGRAITESVRRPDACFRWGGDEFAVVLTDTDAAGAARAAARVEDHVARTCRVPDGPAISVSCGSAQLRAGMTGDDLLAAADRGLLERKAQRRAAAQRA